MTSLFDTSGVQEMLFYRKDQAIMKNTAPLVALAAKSMLEQMIHQPQGFENLFKLASSPLSRMEVNEAMHKMIVQEELGMMRIHFYKMFCQMVRTFYFQAMMPIVMDHCELVGTVKSYHYLNFSNQDHEIYDIRMQSILKRVATELRLFTGQEPSEQLIHAVWNSARQFLDFDSQSELGLTTPLIRALKNCHIVFSPKELKKIHQHQIDPFTLQCAPIIEAKIKEKLTSLITNEKTAEVMRLFQISCLANFKDLVLWLLKQVPNETKKQMFTETFREPLVESMSSHGRDSFFIIHILASRPHFTGLATMLLEEIMEMKSLEGPSQLLMVMLAIAISCEHGNEYALQHYINLLDKNFKSDQIPSQLNFGHMINLKKATHQNTGIYQTFLTGLKEFYREDQPFLTVLQPCITELKKELNGKKTAVQWPFFKAAKQLQEDIIADQALQQTPPAVPN